MSKESLMERMLCSWGRVELSRLRRGYLDDQDWMRITQAADEISILIPYLIAMGKSELVETCECVDYFCAKPSSV